MGDNIDANHIDALRKQVRTYKYAQGTPCPRCNSRIGKDHYCRDCGYGYDERSIERRDQCERNEFGATTASSARSPGVLRGT